MTADPDERGGPQTDGSEALLDFLSGHLQRSRSRREGGRGTSRFRPAVVPSLGAAGALALVALNVLVFGNLIHAAQAGGTPAAHTDAKTSATAASSHHARSRPAATQAATTAAEPVATPKLVHVRLTAARNDSWVEVRAGSATGRVLFDGVVRQGTSISVRGRSLWARFGAIGNFDVSIDGRTVHPALNGTVDTVITGSGRLAPAP